MDNSVETTNVELERINYEISRLSDTEKLLEKEISFIKEKIAFIRRQNDNLLINIPKKYNSCNINIKNRQNNKVYRHYQTTKQKIKRSELDLLKITGLRELCKELNLDTSRCGTLRADYINLLLPHCSN
jgi:ElaB/YqjD/DUF883 family membrane-anchored ribosome-binding protein